LRSLVSRQARWASLTWRLTGVKRASHQVVDLAVDRRSSLTCLVSLLVALEPPRALALAVEPRRSSPSRGACGAWAAAVADTRPAPRRSSSESSAFRRRPVAASQPACPGGAPRRVVLWSSSDSIVSASPGAGCRSDHRVQPPPHRSARRYERRGQVVRHGRSPRRRRQVVEHALCPPAPALLDSPRAHGRAARPAQRQEPQRLAPLERGASALQSLIIRLARDHPALRPRAPQLAPRDRELMPEHQDLEPLAHPRAKAKRPADTSRTTPGYRKDKSTITSARSRHPRATS
jgi:hypothetical protein